MKNGKRRNALSDLTNSNHFSSSSSSISSSSSVSSPATIQPINNNQNNTRKTGLNPLDVKPSTVHRTNNQKMTPAFSTPLTVRCKKKQRAAVSTEQEDLKDFIAKQKAYFKQVDEFELEEEEVECIHE